MNLSQMHVWFRQYAQQMGMQNTRAILPEQIDVLINTSTEDIIDELVRTNVGVTNDRVITDNSKIGSINALRTLYRVITLDVAYPDDSLISGANPDQSTKLSKFNNGIKPYRFTSETIPPYRYIVDFSVSYGTGEVENNDFVYKNKTKLFPVRVIEDSYLADVQNDYVLAPRPRSPIVVIYGGTTKNVSVDNGVETVNFVDDNYQTFDMYFGDTSHESYIDNLYLGKLRISYIKSPRKVKYLSDVGTNNVESDLPEQLQIPMLKHAVDLYRISIQGSLMANQDNARLQQQEDYRNNARPNNDGYQS